MTSARSPGQDRTKHSDDLVIECDGFSDPASIALLAGLELHETGPAQRLGLDKRLGERRLGVILDQRDDFYLSLRTDFRKYLITSCRDICCDGQQACDDQKPS